MKRLSEEKLNRLYDMIGANGRLSSTRAEREMKLSRSTISTYVDGLRWEKQIPIYRQGEDCFAVWNGNIEKENETKFRHEISKQYGSAIASDIKTAKMYLLVNNQHKFIIINGSDTAVEQLMKHIPEKYGEDCKICKLIKGDGIKGNRYELLKGKPRDVSNRPEEARSSKNESVNVKPQIKEEKPQEHVDRHNYAEKVSMTSVEYDDLVKQYGYAFINECIKMLNDYKIKTNKEYTSDYHAILNWVIRTVQTEKGNVSSKCSEDLKDIMKYLTADFEKYNGIMDKISAVKSDLSDKDKVVITIDRNGSPHIAETQDVQRIKNQIVEQLSRERKTCLLDMRDWAEMVVNEIDGTVA